MLNAPEGQIFTFYSYKGGTGRSMALANVAWILASNGYRVLTVDWDLEAPGLHRYFGPFLIDPELTASDGLIDLMFDFSSAALSPGSGAGGELEEWLSDRVESLAEYILAVRNFEGQGVLHLLPSGRQGRTYATRLSSFQWTDFYERFGGGLFIDSIKRWMRGQYDFILIDSRTGVSDTSGICTVQMPDALVLCFTFNRQSVEGAASVARSVREHRGDLSIYPVPCRVELSERERLGRARDYARRAFDDLLFMMPASERARYWGDVEMLYQPFYAYEEVLAVFADRPGMAHSLLSTCERLASYLARRPLAVTAGNDSEAQQILARYLGAIRRVPS
jgi:MinD-like ATPase involved in chromosome partitioning or flagellar assembly